MRFEIHNKSNIPDSIILGHIQQHILELEHGIAQDITGTVNCFWNNKLAKIDIKQFKAITIGTKEDIIHIFVAKETNQIEYTYESEGITDCYRIHLKIPATECAIQPGTRGIEKLRKGLDTRYSFVIQIAKNFEAHEVVADLMSTAVHINKEEWAKEFNENLIKDREQAIKQGADLHDLISEMFSGWPTKGEPGYDAMEKSLRKSEEEFQRMNKAAKSGLFDAAFEEMLNKAKEQKK
jgi:hypothetical protein